MTSKAIPENVTPVRTRHNNDAIGHTQCVLLKLVLAIAEDT